jgi:hypothetical protein
LRRPFFTRKCGHSPHLRRNFVDLVVPELQNRGRLRTAYPEQPMTLRGIYTGAGNARVGAQHPASGIRL